MAAANSAHRAASYNGFVYDQTYFDADTDTSYNTFYGTTGLTTGVNGRTANYSGNNGLGSDGDLVMAASQANRHCQWQICAAGRHRGTTARHARLRGERQRRQRQRRRERQPDAAQQPDGGASFARTGGQGGTPIDPSLPTPLALLTSPHA